MRERETERRWWQAAASVAVALMLALVGSPAVAQDEDLPGRVGRLADFAGQILVSSQDRPDDWEPVGVNYPITSGVNLWVSGDGRAEVDYGGGQFRLAGDTNVHVVRLDDRELTLFVAQGQAIVRVRVQDPGETTFVDTPNSQLALVRPGLYRIDVAPDRQMTTLVVREGEATLALPIESRRVLPGEAISVTGSDAAVSSVGYAQAADVFDIWSANRDRAYEALRASEYVSRQMVGAADLDRYGAWQTTREYGPVWFPYTVAPDWAPYSDGYWTELGGWGPTWVDSAPWGYAPFHYGRWAFIGGRWGWCPGGYVARPVWAPALVAWYGGPGWAVTLTGGRPVYGWVPLGWREAYHPGWRRCSANCWSRFNRPYGVNATDRTSGPPARHLNLAVPGALSAVPASSFNGRTPVRSNRVNVPAELASPASAMRTIPPIRTGERQIPREPSAVNLPPAASTYARPQRSQPQPVSVPAARPTTPTVAPTRQTPATAYGTQPAVSGTLPPTQTQRTPQAIAPGYTAPRAGPAPQEVSPQRGQMRAPPSPSLAPTAPVTSPSAPAITLPANVAPPAVVPAPSPPSQPVPPPSGNAGGNRGATRSVPEPPSIPQPAEPRR